LPKEGTGVKRLFDFAAAGLGLALLSPLLASIALLIKTTSRGPVFFRQDRVGRGGRLFRIFKFRTMVNGRPGNGRNVTVSRDRRITGVGRFLRRSKIDELPQLFNVLCGEMSIVGPRPEVPEYVDLFWREYEPILRIRPGITHRASILYRDEEKLLNVSDDPERFYVEEVMPRKLALYTQDLDRESLGRDVRTIFDTIVSVARVTSSDRLPASGRVPKVRPRTRLRPQAERAAAR